MTTTIDQASIWLTDFKFNWLTKNIVDNICLQALIRDKLVELEQILIRKKGNNRYSGGFSQI
jgi:hypothetical protein